MTSGEDSWQSYLTYLNALFVLLLFRLLIDPSFGCKLNFSRDVFVEQDIY